MTLRRILKFEITCDGYYPDGRKCPCETTIEAHSQYAAEEQARQTGWYQDHRGWICNAAGGHRDDNRKPKPETTRTITTAAPRNDLTAPYDATWGYVALHPGINVKAGETVGTLMSACGRVLLAIHNNRAQLYRRRQDGNFQLASETPLGDE